MANMLYVKDVATYLRQLIDEPDGTFVTDAMLQSWMEIGHTQYYQLVTGQNPERFVASTNIAVSGTSFDLNGVLVGSAAPARMLNILRIAKVAPNGLVSYLLRGTNSLEQLQSPSGFGAAFTMQGTTLYFSAELNDTYRLDYIPMPTIDWSKFAPADNEFIDDLVQFHDMIALYAAEQYFAADAQPNPMIGALLGARSAAFTSYVARGRDINASRFVHVEDPWY
jgi:hypothetical protein